MKRILQILIVGVILYALWTGGTALQERILAKGRAMIEEVTR